MPSATTAQLSSRSRRSASSLRITSPYEALKALTRTNTHITAEAIAAFIAGLDVSEEVKAELRAITPASYTGIDF